jgi:DNA-binding PadR family transcriptional regulator
VKKINYPHKHHFGHWMRHMASVPKGFLKYAVLKLLQEKPLSGSEIMTQIEKNTEGHWKPSPGSIYPLLAWLQEKGYTKETPIQEPNIKRYTLTNEGKSFLQEHIKRREEIQERFGAFRPPFHMFPWRNPYPKKTKQLLSAGKDFIKISKKLLENLAEKYSQEATDQAEEIIKQATKKLNEIANKLE